MRYGKPTWPPYCARAPAVSCPTLPRASRASNTPAATLRPSCTIPQVHTANLVENAQQSAAPPSAYRSLSFNPRRAGRMKGSVHPRVLENELAPPLEPGTVLVLKQVSVFRPGPRAPCCLNITVKNVVRIYDAATECDLVIPVRSFLICHLYCRYMPRQR